MYEGANAANAESAQMDRGFMLNFIQDATNCGPNNG